MKFKGRVSDKQGRELASTIQDSREECARVLFAIRPGAKTVSTSVAHLMADGTWVGGSNIQWTDRYEFNRKQIAEAAKCA